MKLKARLEPYTLSGNLMLVPQITAEKVCGGCVLEEGSDSAPRENDYTGNCSMSRCRYVVSNGHYVDFILISPEKLEKYKAAYAAYKLDGEFDREFLNSGGVWDFYQSPEEATNE